MLDMIDTQDKLKNFSEDQLIKEMQMPSGSAPQFMVLGEIERRKRMRADSQRQEGLMQPTVAQEAVNGAGVPQGGLAGIAQSLAPKTDMTQNTGVPNAQAAALPAQPNQPQKMAGGGIMRLAVGGDMSLGTLPNIAYFKATHPDVYERVKDDPEALRMYAELFAPGGSRDAEITGLEALETPRKMDLLKRAFRDPTRGMIKDQQKRDAEMFGADYAADQSRQSMENSMTAVMTDDPTGLFAEGAPVEYLPSVPPTVDPEPVVAETDLGPAGQFGPVAYAERARIADERNAARLQEIKLQGELDDLKVPEADPETGFIPRHPGDKLFYQQQAAGGQGTDDDVDQRTYANIGSTELNTPKIRNALDTDNGAGLLTEIRNAAQNGADNSSQNLVGGLASIEEAARKAEAARMMSVNEIPERGEVPFDYREMHGGVEAEMAAAAEREAARKAEAARMMSVNEIPELGTGEVPVGVRRMHADAEAEMAAAAEREVARKVEAARMMGVNEIPERGAPEGFSGSYDEYRDGFDFGSTNRRLAGQDAEQAKNQQDIYDFLAGAEGAPPDDMSLIDRIDNFRGKDGNTDLRKRVESGKGIDHYFPDYAPEVATVNRAAQKYYQSDLTTPREEIYDPADMSKYEEEAAVAGASPFYSERQLDAMYMDNPEGRRNNIDAMYGGSADLYGRGARGRLDAMGELSNAELIDIAGDPSNNDYGSALEELGRRGVDTGSGVFDEQPIIEAQKNTADAQTAVFKAGQELKAAFTEDEIKAAREALALAEEREREARLVQDNTPGGILDVPFVNNTLEPNVVARPGAAEGLASLATATDPRSPLGEGGKSAGIIAARKAAREAASKPKVDPKVDPKVGNTAVAKIGEELTQREKKANQDKWLALAYAGAELLDSGSFGKAAKAGLGAYSKNVEGTRNYETETKKLDAEIMLRNAQMAAANRKSTGKVPAGIIDNLEDRRTEIMARLEGMPFPEERWYGDVLGKPTDPYAVERRELNARLESLTSQINSAYASQGVTMPAGPAGPVRKQA